MDAVIVGFRSVIVCVTVFCGLAKIIRVSSVSDNAAAASIGSPGDDRPCWSYALNARAVSNFLPVRLRRLLWCRGGGRRQSRCQTMIVSNFIDSIPPLLGSDQYADVFGVEPEIQGFQGIFMVEKTPLLATS